VIKKMAKWNKFPHDNSAFVFAGSSLEEAWVDLHQGDCVEFPDADWVEQTLEQAPDAAPESFDGDVSALAETIQDAWRCYHSGDFQKAVKLADQCGLIAHAVANKATGIYATYLESDESAARELFLSAAERAEAAINVLPDDPNSYYFHAFNLGRYSQSISIVKALSQGIGGKIQSSLENAIDLQPEHADANIALGAYYAEVIDKVGKLLGKLTYGATPAKALKHFEQALELSPDAPIAHIEYGNGLYLLYGDDRLDDVTDLYVNATEMEPVDAMAKLDIEAALAEME
jgi:tetratricopeptide (TPR) repeat protein